MRLRRWRGTVNGPEDDVRACYARLAEKSVGVDSLRLLVCQLERGEEANRLHIQFYTEWSRAVTPGSLQHFFGLPISHFPCDAGRQANINYASKPDTRVDGPLVIGDAEVSRQGLRSDLLRLQSLSQSALSEVDLWEQEFPLMAKHWKAVCRYRNLRSRTPSCGDDPPVTVYVYWGSTGLGKSRRAHREAAAAGAYCVPPLPEPGQSTWFPDGFEPGTNLLLDDYHGNYSLSFFKRLLDRYPVTLPVKHGFVERGTGITIWITSNHDPADWYPTASQVDRDAIRRRFTRVEHYSAPFGTAPRVVDPLDQRHVAPVVNATSSRSGYVLERSPSTSSTPSSHAGLRGSGSPVVSSTLQHRPTHFFPLP